MLFQSCLLKKVQEFNEDKRSNDNTDTKMDVIGRGYFTHESQIYFSNGNDAFCALESWEQLESFLSKESITNLGELELPRMQKMQGRCTEELVFGELKLLSK